MRQKIKNVCCKLKEKAGKAMAVFLNQIDKNHEKGSWVNLAGLGADAVVFAAYRALSPLVAEYERTDGIRSFSAFAGYMILFIGIWEFLCLTGSGWLRFLGRAAGGYTKMAAWGRKAAGIAAIGIMLAVCLAVGLWEKHEVTYYKELVEIYGVPVGLGDPLKEEELDEYLSCWKMEEYKRQGRITLTYMEPYRSLELMEQYSTVYGMTLFKPSARIEVTYTRDREKFNGMGQEIFAAARDNGFREAEQISYYNSSERLTLRLKKNRYGKFEVTHYRAQDMPQLYHSTLLRIPEGQMIGNGMAFKQMEVSYNKAGLVEERRLSPRFYNCYGVNGERYEYDENKRVSTLYYLDIDGEAVCNKLGIMRIDFQYEDNGNLHSIRYYGDEEGTKKIEGFQGVFCEKFAYDSRGRLYERYQQDRNENLRCDRNGVCMYRYQYGEEMEDGKKNQSGKKIKYGNGKRIEEKFLGFTGEPVRHNQLYDKHVIFDETPLEDGSCELCVSTDAIHPPFISGGDQENTDVIEQDNRSLLSKQTVLWEERMDFAEWFDGQKARSDSGRQDRGPESLQAVEQYGSLENQDAFPEQYELGEQQTASIELGNDAWIRVEEESDLAYHSPSIHYVIERDGTIRSVSYCDDTGTLMENEDGYARKILEYDNQGRISWEQYRNANDKPCLTSDGYAKVTYEYRTDQSDELESITYQDVFGHAAINRKLGYSRLEYEYEPIEQGKKIRKKYLDKEGKPVRIPGQEYAIVDQYYNERNFLVEEVYVEESGKEGKIRRKDYGVAEIRYVYDDRGNLICEFYKDVDGKLVNRLDTGYAMVHRRFQGGQMVHCHYTGYHDRMYGKVIDKTTGVASIEYLYKDGLKTGEVYYDTDGMLALRKDTGCAVQKYEYDDGGSICAEFYYGTDRKPVLRKDTGYAAAKYQNNENGQHSAVYFYGTDGELTLNIQDRCAGISYEYEEEERKAAVRYFGTDGGLLERQGRGYAQIEMAYDDGGNVKRVAYLDEKSQLVVRKDVGYASYENTYEMGRWVESRYYNEYGSLVKRPDTGYAVIRNQYIGSIEDNGEGFGMEAPDKEGLLVSQTFLDDKETPVDSTKYHCAQIRFVYDGQGNRIRTQYMDEQGKPVVRADLGYALMEQIYDEAGRCISVRYYDGLGEPAISRQYGCAGLWYQYDERGNRTDIGYMGKERKFMVNRDLGYARLKAEYDELGNRVKEIYLDIDGKPALWKEGGCASREFVYDGRECVEERYLDERGKLVPHKDNGYAIVKYQYDDQGRPLLETYYNVRESTTLHKRYHCAGRKFAYDETGRRTDEWYLDWDGAPMARRDLGYAQVHWEYDKFGNQVSESYFGADGEPVIRRGVGNASCKFAYDDNGNCVEEQYLDIHRRPMLRADYGYATVCFQYNELGQCVSEAYYGTRGQPVVHLEYGCAGREFTYDERGNLTKNRHTGLNGGPMIYNGLGYVQVCWEYDIWGNKIETSYYDVSGRPVLCRDGGYAFCSYQYDGAGNCIEKRYYNAEYQPIRHRNGDYASVRYEYDDFGQCISVWYYDEMDLPVRNGKYFCFGFEYGYDEQGNQTDTWYLDQDGILMVREDLGCAGLHSKYDKFGNEVRVECLNEKGDLAINRTGGYAYAEYVYDYYNDYNNYNYGNCVERRYYGTDGNLILRKDGGYAIVAYDYNIWGERILIEYHDCDDRLVINSDYYAALFGYDYDEWGNNTQIWYYGEAEELIEREDTGAVMYQNIYDACGRLLSGEYYGFDPEVDQQIRLTLHKDLGYAVMEQEFGSPNSPEMTSRRYLDAEGNPVAPEGIGYAIREREYDDAGQLFRETYYDAEGNLTSPADDEVSIVEWIYDETGNFIGQTRYDRHHQKIVERSRVSEIDYGRMPILDRWRRERQEIKIKEWN